MEMQEILKSLRDRFDTFEEIPDITKAIKAIDTLLDIDCFYRSIEPSVLKSFKLFLEQVRFELKEGWKGE